MSRIIHFWSISSQMSEILPQQRWLTLCDGVMKAEGSWVSLSSVHTRQPGRGEGRVTCWSFVITKLTSHELKKWSRGSDEGEIVIVKSSLSASVCHLLLLQGNFRFDSQDQIRRVVPQLPDVLIDVPILQCNIVIYMSVQQAARDKKGWQEIYYYQWKFE